MENIKSKKIYKAKVCAAEKAASNSYFIEFDCGMPVCAEPGQFVSIYCEGLTLRRPFSVFSNNNGLIGILFKEKGKGTKYLKSLNIGDFADITGVFGNGFEIKNKKALLLGAGIGIAPVCFLKTELNKRRIENLLISGFLNKDEIPSCTKPDKVCTMDGSAGMKGSVLDYLEEIIKEYKPEIIYACGPLIVLEKTAQTGIKYGIETQVSMEKVMACSIGVCRGCVIDVLKDGAAANASVCKDGPVFNAQEVVWAH